MVARWLLLAILIGVQIDNAALAAERTLESVAETVRKAGFECRSPEDVYADKSKSGQNKDAWVIQCAGDRFRVVYPTIGDPVVAKDE